MLKKIASIISTLLHPMLMPTLGILVIFSTQSHITFLPYEYRRLVTIIVLISTCILPLSVIPLFIQTKIIKSVQMDSSRERIIPLMVTGLFFIIGYYFLKKIQLPAFISLFFLGTLVALIISLSISFFWKISIHMVGIGGVLGALIAISIKYGVNTNMWLLLGIAISGLLGSSRLALEAHNPKQVYSGFIVGMICILSIAML